MCDFRNRGILEIEVIYKQWVLVEIADIFRCFSKSKDKFENIGIPRSQGELANRSKVDNFRN